MATYKYINLVETWLKGQSNVGVSDQISDPFEIVTDQQKFQNTNTPGSTSVSNKIPILASKGDNLPGDISPPSHHNQINRDASNSF